MPGFQFVDTPEPHRGRARKVLAEHPEIRALYGRNPWTAAIVVGLVLLQVGLAVAFGLLGAPWWAVLIVAWAIGALASHALYAAIHECAHQMVFTDRRANFALAIAANAALALPMAVAYMRLHLKHHRHQGDPERDPDLPAPGEARWVGGSMPRKILWQLAFPVVQVLRTTRPGLHATVDRWVVANVAAVLAVDALLAVLAGSAAPLYLLASFWFTMALHPLSARFIQEHHLARGPDGRAQETTSYHGPLNAVSLNVGYHNEHHDFPFVAWNRLPEVTAAAPELYGALHTERSWTSLWWRFLSDRSMTLFDRVARTGEANLARGRE